MKTLEGEGAVSGMKRFWLCIASTCMPSTDGALICCHPSAPPQIVSVEAAAFYVRIILVFVGTYCSVECTRYTVRRVHRSIVPTVNTDTAVCTVGVQVHDTHRVRINTVATAHTDTTTVRHGCWREPVLFVLKVQQ